MSNFNHTNQNIPNVFFDPNINTLLNIYGRVMLLKLYVDDENDIELKNMYINASHNHNKKIFNNKQKIPPFWWDFKEYVFFTYYFLVLITSSMIPYATASSADNQKSRVESFSTTSAGLPQNSPKSSNKILLTFSHSWKLIRAS